VFRSEHQKFEKIRAAQFRHNSVQCFQTNQEAIKLICIAGVAPLPFVFYALALAMLVLWNLSDFEH
jgi:hypothetical protein